MSTLDVGAEIEVAGKNILLEVAPLDERAIAVMLEPLAAEWNFERSSADVECDFLRNRNARDRLDFTGDRATSGNRRIARDGLDFENESCVFGRKKIELEARAAQTEKIRIRRVAVSGRADVVRADARRKKSVRRVRRSGGVVEIPNELRLEKQRRFEPLDPRRHRGFLLLRAFELFDSFFERANLRGVHRVRRVVRSFARRDNVDA